MKYRNLITIPPLQRWMREIEDFWRISQLSIPGTHNSCARMKGVSFGFARCQTRYLIWQLENGIRFLDIRCVSTKGTGPPISFKRTRPYFRIFHGFIYQERTFDEVLDTCFDFLSKNPKETIIMRVQDEGSSPNDDFYLEIFNMYLTKYGRHRFYLGTNMPTLGEIRGKIVLLTRDPYIGEGLHYNDQIGQDEYNNPQVDYKKEMITKYLNYSSSSNGWRLYFNFLSASGAGKSLWTPWSYAKIMNPFTLAKILDNYQDKFQLGVVVYDYAGAGTGKWDDRHTILARAIISRNIFKESTESYRSGRNLILIP